jgi:hypothetical protein
MKGILGGGSSKTGDDQQPQETKDSESKCEGTLQAVLRHVQLQYKERGLCHTMYTRGLCICLFADLRYFESLAGLTGSVYIAQGVGPFTTALNADIDETTEAEVGVSTEEDDDGSTTDDAAAAAAAAAEPEAKEKKTRIISMVCSATDRVIKNLLKRAKSWRTTQNRENVTLTSGISVSDPIFGAVNFSISLTATIPSLLACIDSHKDFDK